MGDSTATSTSPETRRQQLFSPLREGTEQPKRKGAVFWNSKLGRRQNGQRQ
jgi:hypothetical protein